MLLDSLTGIAKISVCLCPY